MIYFLPLLIMLYGFVRFEFHNASTLNPMYRKLWVVTFWLLVLIPGLSYRIGVDTPSYMAFYEEIKPIENTSFNYFTEQPDEIFWTFFCSLCKSISSEYAFMHMVQCLILHICVFHFIKKYTKKCFVALSLYYVVLWAHLTFEAIRESFAIALYLFALSKLIDKNSYKQYFLIALPGLFFHRFSFIVILLTPLVWMSRRLKVFIPLLLLVAVLVVLNIQWFIDMFIQDLIADNDRMAYYVESNMEGDQQMSLIGVVSYLVKLVLPPLLIIYLYKKDRCSEVNDGIVMLLIFATLLGCMASLMTDFRRIYNYFIVLEGVMFGNILAHRNYLKKTLAIKNSFRGLCLLICMIELLNCKDFYKPSILETRKNVTYDVYYFPYHSVFTKEKDPMREAVHRVAY